MQYDTIPFPVQAMERHFLYTPGETRELLSRMNLVDAEGELHKAGLRILADALGTSFYQSLLEFGEDLPDICFALADLSDNKEATGAYLYLCLLYGEMGQVIPETLQWISTHKEAVLVYCDRLCNLLLEHMVADGILNGNPEDGERDDNVIPFTSSPDTKDRI